MEGQQVEIDNIANNLANTNTTGFKQSRVNFEDLFYQTVNLRELILLNTFSLLRAFK